MTDILELLPIATEAVTRARKIMLDHAPGTVTYKSERDMATEVDYAIEDAVRSFLQQETPEIAFLGEEGGGSTAQSNGLVWTLDPVDGTANFVHGVPLCAVSLGLVTEKDSVLGVVDLPFIGQQYTATKGNGAYADGQTIHCANSGQVSEALVSIGDYAVGSGAEKKNAHRLELTATLARHVQRVRMLGAAAVDLCWVAEGKLDAAVMLSNKPWDTAAGVLIAREAGATVLDLDGASHQTDSAATLAITPRIAAELLDLIQAAVHT